MRIGLSADAKPSLDHEQLAQAVMDLGVLRTKSSIAPEWRGKKHRAGINQASGNPISSGNQTKVIASKAAVNSSYSTIDLTSLRQICPAVAGAVEEFITFLEKIKLEVSRESDAARLIGIEKAARFLDVSDDSIYRKIKKGTLEACWQGRRPYFTLAELKRHIDALPRKPESKG